jgi:hypothetical protein
MRYVLVALSVVMLAALAYVTNVSPVEAQNCTPPPTYTPYPTYTAYPTYTPPAGESRAANTPTPTVTPALHGVGLKLDQYITYRTRWGTLYVLGDLINLGDADATDIEVAASLLDSHGAVLAVGSYNSVGLGIVRAGSKCPFKVAIDGAPEEWASESIQIAASPFDEAGFHWLYYYDLATEGVRASANRGEFTIAGRVANTGMKAASVIRIIAVLYDEQGKIMDADTTTAALHHLDPGARSPFKIAFADLGGKPAGYVLYLEATESD